MKILVAKSQINIGQVKPGKLLISRKNTNDELLNRSVILILEHDENGSTGIILNKAGIPINSLTGDPDERIYHGGTYDTHRVGVILSNNHYTQKAVKIAEGIYYSENHCSLKEKNFSQAMNTANLKAYIGFTVWDAGQLEREIEDNNWWIEDFSPDELNYIKDEDFWEYKVMRSNTLFGLFHKKSYLSSN